jgi:hypothetical protein
MHMCAVLLAGGCWLMIASQKRSQQPACRVQQMHCCFVGTSTRVTTIIGTLLTAQLCVKQ